MNVMMVEINYFILIKNIMYEKKQNYVAGHKVSSPRALNQYSLRTTNSTVYVY